MKKRIDEIISKAVKREGTPKKRIPGWFHAGEAGKCPRAIFYNIKRPGEYNVETLKKFYIGTLIHETIQGMLKGNFELLEIERPVTITDMETDLVVSGVVDVFLISKNERIVLELKSVNSLYYLKQENKPNDHHISQITMYMRAMKADKGYLIYIDKSNLETMSFEIKYDPKRFFDIMDKFRNVYYKLGKNTLPNQSPSGDWECKFCLYKKECGKNEVIQ